jgi:polar amino acid transport system substrate-binding protein
MRHTIRTFLTLGALAVASALAVPGQASAADGVDAIKQRGTLIVGVKADYKPFGFRDPSGTIIGLEPDLAADLAKRLGVKLELVPVVSANRIEFLQQGKVDLLIATLSDKPERRRVVQAIDPQYYSDFVNVLLPKTSGITDWAQLKGKPLCATSGAWYNKDVARTYGAEIVAFDGSEKPLFALKQGNCLGYDPRRAVDDGGRAGQHHAPGDGRGRDQGLDEDRLHRRRREEVGHRAHRLLDGHAREVQERGELMRVRSMSRDVRPR